MKTILTYGTFDLFHKGHLEILRRAKEMGNFLIVGVTIEKFNVERGKTNVIDSFEKRCQNVLKTGLVDKIIPDISFPQKEFDIKENNVDIVVMGSDWSGKFDYCKEWGVDVVYLERTPNISTTLLKNTNMESYIVRDKEENLRIFKGCEPYKVGDVWTNEQTLSCEIINKGVIIKDLDMIERFKVLSFNDKPVKLAHKKVDIVIPHVNNEDEMWIKLYEKYICIKISF